MLKIGTSPVDELFIDRKRHLPLLKSYIDKKQSFVIKAPRRFGKTSIIKHLLKNEKLHTFVYVDISRMSNLKSLANIIVNEAYKLSLIDDFLKQARESMLDLFNRVSELKIKDIAEVTLRMIEKDVNDVEYFLHSLDVMNSIARKEGVDVKFVFDEFQDILDIASEDILSKSRSVIQQHHKNITYIFLGSIESTMTQIFEKKGSPFVHFSIVVELPPLDINEVYKHSNNFFSSNRIEIPFLINALNFFNGHPDYTIQFIQKLYFTILAKSIITIDKNLIEDIIISVYRDNRAYVMELVEKAKQKKHRLDVLYSIANNKKNTLDSKTLYNTHVSLEEIGIIKKVSKGKYEIIDIFLWLYLQDEVKDVEDMTKDERSLYLLDKNKSFNNIKKSKKKD